MPHLHLPIEHTDADLALAADLAEIVGSEDLYVAWSHETGAGGVPAVDAVLVEPARPSLFAEVACAIVAGCAAFWRALLGRPGDAALRQAPSAGPARQGEPSV
jgi:ribosomal protein S12 methylthiotransferase accessory factor YcaO